MLCLKETITTEQKKNVKKWIKALESGKYSQTKNVLCKKKNKKVGYGFCCLGVAADVAKKRIDKTIPFVEYDGDVFYDGECVDLSERILDLYGIAEQGELAQMNDEMGKRFKTIAKKIKKDLKKVKVVD